MIRFDEYRDRFPNRVALTQKLCRIVDEGIGYGLAPAPGIVKARHVLIVIARSAATRQPRQWCARTTRLLRCARNDRGWAT
jgi:hypothetical protein